MKGAKVVLLAMLGVTSDNSSISPGMSNNSLQASSSRCGQSPELITAKPVPGDLESS